MNDFSQPMDISLFVLLCIILGGFFAGYLLRTLHRNKAKTRILELEDEMLRNHAKILSLEKSMADLKRENNQLRNNQARRSQEPKLRS